MNARYVPLVLAGLAGLCLVAIGANYAVAQSCYPISQAIQGIAGPPYNETPVLSGVMEMGNGSKVPIMGYANSKTGTFTMFLRPAPDRACPLASGTEFQILEPEAPKEGQGT